MSIFAGQADLLAELFAATAKWKTITQTTTAADAKRKIAIHEAEDRGQPKLSYPRIVIYDGGTIERNKLATSTWGGRGSLIATFEIELTKTHGLTAAAQRATFSQLISDLWREAEVISDSRAAPSGYSTSHLQITTYRRSEGPQYVPPTERGPQDGVLKTLWQMEFEVEY